MAVERADANQSGRRIEILFGRQVYVTTRSLLQGALFMPILAGPSGSGNGAEPTRQHEMMGWPLLAAKRRSTSPSTADQ